jgi:hypothetical protein
MREELVNIRLTRYFDVSVGLIDIDAVKRLENAFVTEVDTVFNTDNTNEVFDSVDIDAFDGQIVNLSTYEHAVPFVGSLVEATLMRRRFETMSRDDGIDKLFPEGTGFGVTLKSMLYREDHVFRDDTTVSTKVPVGILCIDDNKGRLIWWR